MNGTMAVITCFAPNFAPKNWALCNGQILGINTNQALFSLLGTTYGGNGTTNFALPNLQGRVPVGWGQGPGMGNYSLGELGGRSIATLLLSNLPAHIHTPGTVSVSQDCDNSPASEQLPDGFYIAGINNAYAATETPGVNIQQPAYTATIGTAGNNQPISLMPPYLAINYIICMFGIFPSRD